MDRDELIALRAKYDAAEWAHDWQHAIVPPGKPAHELACAAIRALPTLFAALESRPAPTEERQVASHVDDELTRSFIDGWNARLDHADFDLALHFWMRDGAGIPAASLPRAQAFTPSRDEEGSVDRDAVIEEVARHIEQLEPLVTFGPPDGISIISATRANVTRAIRTLKTSTPETQTVEGGERLAWHMPDNLRWLAEQSDRPAYMPCGMLTGMFLQDVAERLETLVTEKHKPTTSVSAEDER